MELFQIFQVSTSQFLSDSHFSLELSVQDAQDSQECGYQSGPISGNFLKIFRVAQAATESYNRSLQLAFAGGYFGAAINIALAIFGVSFQFIVFYHYLSISGVEVLNHLELIPLLMVGFGFGASFVAMFAQLGGGIYTKAADVGADLVGKLEKDFP